MDRYLNAAKFYPIELRSVSIDCETVQTYTGKITCNVNNEISFDSENIDLTSIDYFTNSIASSIIFSIINYDQKKQQIIEELECKFKFILENPLSYLSVKGYSQEPRFTKLHMDVYLVSFETEQTLYKLVENAIKKSILYQTVCHSMDISYKIKIIY